MFRTASSQARIHSIELTVLKHAAILDAMFAFSSSTVKKTRGKTITVIQTWEKLTLNTTFFLTQALGNSLQLSSNPQGCQFNLQLLLYLSPPPIPYLNQIKQTARAGKKQRHQFAQKHFTASTKYSRHLSLRPTSDPAQQDWQRMPAEDHRKQHGEKSSSELLKNSNFRTLVCITSALHSKAVLK